MDHKERNVCIVFDFEYPWDVRVEKIAKSLAQNGYSVTIVCRNKNRDPSFQKLMYADILRFPYVKSVILNKLINITIPFNPFWLFRVYCAVKTYNSALILVRDLPLSITGLIIGQLTKRPVCIDFAEPYPLTIRQRRLLEPFKIYHILTRSYSMARFIEKIAFKHANKVFVVCKEAKNRLIKIGCEPNKIEIVRNTPNIKSINIRNNNLRNPFYNDTKCFIFLYVGVVIGGRGLDTVLLALRNIKKRFKIERIKLVIVGDGKAKRQLIKDAQKLNVSEMVDFVGWIKHENTANYIKYCDVGILPFSNTEHINTTLANKIFDFMALEKPILCSNVKPMKRIIKTTRAGFLFEPDDPISLSNKMIEVASISREKLNSFGKQGYEAINHKYNWGNDESTLITTLKNVLSNFSKKNGIYKSEKTEGNKISCNDFFRID